MASVTQEKYTPGYASNLLTRVLYQEKVDSHDEEIFTNAVLDPHFLLKLSSEMLQEDVNILLRHAEDTLENYEDRLKDKLEALQQKDKEEGKPVVLRSGQEIHDYVMTFTTLLHSYQDPEIVKAENISQIDRIRASLIALGYLPFSNPQTINHFTRSDRSEESIRQLRDILRRQYQTPMKVGEGMKVFPIPIKPTGTVNPQPISVRV